MAITVISAPPPGISPAASSGSTMGTEPGNGGFGSLFAQLLAGGTGVDAGIPLADDKQAPRDALSLLQDRQSPLPVSHDNSESLLTGSETDSILTTALPASMQALLGTGKEDTRDTRRGRKEEKEEATETNIGLLGSLQAPVIPISPLNVGGNHSAVETGMLGINNQTGTELPFLNNPNSANLAGAHEDFSHLLNSSPSPLNGSGTAQTASPTNSSLTPELRTPLNDPRWSQEFGEKIVWMARNEHQQAQLSLNPAHLGPLQITLNLDADNKASAVFTAATPEVRQAIEDAMPRLREMLAGSGVSLGQTHVGTQAQQEQAAQQGRRPSQGERDEAILEADSSTAPL